MVIRRALPIVILVSVSTLLIGVVATQAFGSRMMGGNSANVPSRWAGATNTSCSVPTDLPGQLIKVTFRDMARMGSMMGGGSRVPMRLFATPNALHSGPVSIIAANLGWQEHELVVLPLAKSQSVGQRIVGLDGRVDETGSLAEASNNCGSGVGEGVEPGALTWTTVDLAPGRYEFICNLPGHYQAGMYQELVVTAA